MPVYLDATGGDQAPDINVLGAVIAAKNTRFDIILVGDELIIDETLRRHGEKPGSFQVLAASETILMEEEPVLAVRRKKNSAIVLGAKAASQPGCAFVSAGSTGALLAASLLITGRVKGISRPAMGVVLPGIRPTLLIDNGANAECRPEHLLQFARMGAAYMKALYPDCGPSVALVNIGTEENKGSTLYKEAHALLREHMPGFTGNIEPKEILSGVADVAVCDGFTGNIVLKSLEGAFSFMMGRFKEILKNDLKSRISSLALRNGLSALKEELGSVGGVPFLGVNGIVLKAHGSSTKEDIARAVAQAGILCENKVLDSIRMTAGDQDASPDKEIANDF